jgi:AraC-like DNA-binding protein
MEETVCWGPVLRLNGSLIGTCLGGELAVRASTATASTPHAQHGTGVFIGLEREVALTRADGRVARGRVVVVPPDVVNAIDSPGPTLGILHDPEAAPRLAAFTRGGGGGGFAVTGRLADRLVEAARAHRARLADPGVLAGLAHECAAALGADAAARRIDRRVARAVEALRDPDADRRRVIEDARISEVHLQALFARDVGVSIRSYRLWRRLLAAIAAFMAADATRAAHAAGFADLAHFSRTCRRMLGYSPTALRDGLGGAIADHAR